MARLMENRYDQREYYEQDNNLRFAHEQGYFDKSMGVRFFIALAFILTLFVFIHFREVRVDVLELNSIAPRYIVAQVPFEFLDDEATIILRQEAVRDIGKIYRISETDISQRRSDFERQLLNDPNWRKQQGHVALSDVYSGLDALKKGLTNLRFTDPRTLKRIQDIGFGASNYQVFTPSSISEQITLPDQIWNTLQKEVLTEQGIKPEAQEIILSYFKGGKWRVDEDIPAQRQLQRMIQADVPDKYTEVSAGSRIIDQGERVTARHIAMIQAMKNAISNSRDLWTPVTLLGTFLMSCLMAGICVAYLKVNYPTILSSNRKLFLLVSVAILTLVLSKLVEYILISSSNKLMQFVRYPLLGPLPAILVCNLLNPAIATFVAGFLTIMLTMTLAFDHGGFIIMNLIASIIAILSTRSLRRRKEIFVVCAKAWLGSAIVVISMHFYENVLWDVSLFADLISSAIFMAMTAVLILGLLPIFEGTFNIMSDVTLMEYMDPNHELLRRLAFEAPGTYQHTLVVGNIAEAAALAIGANGLFCRVSCLYHDVGKVTTPYYFTENQQGDMNVHQLLTPLESAQAIMAHVTEGVAMGRKAGLPEQFIDVIKEHHGTTLVYYFYRKQLDALQGDVSQVKESDFRYPGPKPHSKESAIIMLADSFEAASRSLEQFNETSLTELINRLVREKTDDGQFDDCLLTFEEMAILKKTMVKTLVAAFHSRIKYPLRETSNRSSVPAETA